MGRSSCGRFIGRFARVGVLPWLCFAASATAQAQTLELTPERQVMVRPTSSLELERVDPQVEAPTASTARLYRIDGTPAPANSEQLRTRLWVGNGIGSLGAGADWAAVPGGSPLRPWRPVLGVRADVSTQTRLVYEVRGAAAPWATPGLPGAENQEMRVALEFKSAKSQARNLRDGLFRVQLSSTSMLSLRPRGGGMVVSYRSQF